MSFVFSVVVRSSARIGCVCGSRPRSFGTSSGFLKLSNCFQWPSLREKIGGSARRIELHRFLNGHRRLSSNTAVNKMPEAVATNSIKQEPMELDQDFELISHVKANGIHPVTKYRSRTTGLELIHAQVPGPIVNGYIVLATRAEDHDGLPHTLEHMIFIGSDEYPYKGVLDILANKCLASGTNAWTDVDHTCYTMTTAGSEGFCTLLPIYMDHIFFPILSDSAYDTEVYHINGEGKDGGVVYSEMQALELTGEVKAHTELIRELYPKSSGYHYNTGGQLSNLRESCNNCKVKAFHSKFYNPKNTRVIVTGMVEPEKLFAALQPIVKKLEARKAVPQTWTRPWLDEVPDVPKVVEKTIYFASEEDENDSIVLIGFHGPSAIDNLPEVHALRLLMEYFTDSTVSPLQKEFVENDEPLASSVEYSEMENSRTAFYLQLEGVPMDDCNKIAPRTREVLKKQVEDFDMTRMHSIVKKSFLEELSSMENTPHNSIAYACIGDFLYSRNADDTKIFEQRISVARIVEQFLQAPKSFWTERIQSLLLDQTWVSVYTKPSKEQHELQMREEVGRLEERLHKFGDEGLKKFEYELEQAVAKNMTAVPMDFIQTIQTPTVDSITFHNINRLQNPDIAKNIKCNFYFDDISTNFAYVTVLLDTSSLPVDHRKYLSLFCEAVTESAVVLDDGTVMSHEDVVAALNEDFLSYNCGIGIDGGSRFKCGSYSHIISFSAQMEIANLGKGFEWIKRLFWQTQFKGDRLKVLANKMSTEVNQAKRKGSRMAKLLMKDMIYSPESNMNITSMIRQQIFLKDLATTVGKSDNKVRKILENIRDLIKDPGNVTIHLATNLDNMKNIHKEAMNDVLPEKWTGIFSYGTQNANKRLANEPDIRWMKNLKSLTENPQQYVLGLSSEESSFLVQGIQAVTDFNDPELPAILTTLQYFCQTEGPFYRAIRGAGLAYGYFMDSKANEGMLYFYLYRSSDLVGAYKTALETIQEHLTGKAEWQEDLLDTAKSSLIFEVIEGEKTPLALASTSLCSYYRNVPEGHTKKLMKMIAEVKVTDLKLISEKYLSPLFLKPCNCAAVCPTDKVSAVVEGMGKMGKTMKIMPSIGSSFLSK